MRKYSEFLLLIAFAFLLVTCKKDNQKETILQGETTILVDQTLTPIIEDQVQIFEDQYKAKINIESKSEGEIIETLVKNSSRIAILSRTLTKEEANYFASNKLVPKITPFAKDAIALIINKSNNDTLIALQDVLELMQGKQPSKYKGLVFDNPNSSTARYLCELAGVKNLPASNVFSYQTNEEVIKYVAQNEGMIGIVGINYIFEPTPAGQQYLSKINILKIKSASDNKYYSPTQNNIAEGKYPLARELFIVNCQGYSGLGMGFASFIAGETGQRIVLKSGLVPIRVPSRKIRIRNQINNDKK